MNLAFDDLDQTQIFALIMDFCIKTQVIHEFSIQNHAGLVKNKWCGPEIFSCGLVKGFGAKPQRLPRRPGVWGKAPAPAA